MKKLVLLFIFALLPLTTLAQDGVYEGHPVYDARPNYWLAGTLTTLTTQDPVATFTFTRKISAPTQQEADRKLAAWLGAWAESKGKSGLCVVVNGACLEQNGQIVYDLEKVTAAVEAILEAEISAVAKARFFEPKLKAAKAQAEADFLKQPQPDKDVIKPASRPIVPSRRFRR